MNNETKGFLLFLGGVVWAAVTSKKAYAPTIVTDGGNCKSTLGPQGIEDCLKQFLHYDKS